LIPAFFGLVFVILGLLSRRDKLRKHTMHAAAALALIGCVLSAYRGIPTTYRFLTDETVTWPVAALEQDIMAVLCLIYVELCIKSFLNARRRRRLCQPVS
jgi:hypothetical protein